MQLRWKRSTPPLSLRAQRQPPVLPHSCCFISRLGPHRSLCRSFIPDCVRQSGGRKCTLKISPRSVCKELKLRLDGGENAGLLCDFLVCARVCVCYFPGAPHLFLHAGRDELQRKQIHKPPAFLPDVTTSGACTAYV